MPDLAFLMKGVNTDLAITNSGDAFGTDMGHEIVDQFEAGLTRQFGAVRLDAAFFHDQFTKMVFTHQVPLYDVAVQGIRYVYLHQLTSGGALRGLTLTGEWQASPWMSAGGSYTRFGGSGWTPFGTTSTAFPGPRQDAVALHVRLQAPEDGALRGFGALVTYRRLGGTARLIDPAFGPFPAGFDVRIDGVPAWTSMDLRVGKTVALGSRPFTVYLDARNLLNTTNLLRGFGGSDHSRSPTDELVSWENDSSFTADEAKRGGFYDTATGDVDLTFGGAGRGGCGAWVTVIGQPSPPNCAYIIAAEQRFGNGDGTYTLAEQRAASLAYYRTAYGLSTLTGPGRAVRIGAQIAF
jgi:hypothetical protein